MDENNCEYHGMATKYESFISEIELIYTRAVTLQDHSHKAFFLFIHKSFYPQPHVYGTTQLLP